MADTPRGRTAARRHRRHRLHGHGARRAVRAGGGEAGRASSGPSAGRGRGGGRLLGADAAYAELDALLDVRRGRRRPRLHARTTCTPRWRWRRSTPGTHVVCEKPLATDAWPTPRLMAGRGRRGRRRWPPSRSSTASTRWSARRGPGSRPASVGADQPGPRQLPAGLAGRAHRRQLAGRPRPRRRRPAPSATSARTGATCSSS